MNPKISVPFSFSRGDYLYFGDGVDLFALSSDSWQNMNGFESPYTFSSESSFVKFIFTSDFGHTAVGFSIRLTAVKSLNKQEYLPGELQIL